MKPWRMQSMGFRTAVIEVGGPEICSCTGADEIQRARLITLLPALIDFIAEVAEVADVLPADQARRAGELLRMAGEEVRA